MSAPEHDSTGTPASRPSDLSDLRIGEFLLLRRLGSGGMADVYLAEQTSLGRQVAVKILKSEATSNPGNSDVLIRRFVQEARAAGGLNHPNIVQVITTGRENDISFIVQEYVPGLNLSQWMKKHGSPDYGTGLRWMQQIAAALRAAGEAGVVHRDIKPENIMITRSSTVKVTDFGLAQLNQPAAPRMNLTQIGTTMGTPWYMSPEQIQGEKTDSRSDQYSFGITCYHMFAGQPPFPGKNAMSVAVQHLKESALPLSSRRADLPRELCDVIHRMMQKSPDSRFQSFEDLEVALNRLNQVPVNTKLGAASGWFGRFGITLAEVRDIVLAGLILMLTVFMITRRSDRIDRLPVPPDATAIPREQDAVRQYAVAMLQSDRRAAWEAVISNFPESDEADLARMKLGLTLMSGLFPNEDAAIETFRGVQRKGEIAADKRHLVLLGLVGQAFVLSRTSDEAKHDERERVTMELKNLLSLPETEPEMSLNDAPSEIRRFYYEELNNALYAQ